MTALLALAIVAIPIAAGALCVAATIRRMRPRRRPA